MSQELLDLEPKPQKKLHISIENDTKELCKVLVDSYDKIGKSVKNLKEIIPVLGLIQNRESHTKNISDICQNLTSLGFNALSKEKIGGILKMETVLCQLISIMLGHANFLKNGIEKYEKIEEKERLVLKKLIFGYIDFCQKLDTNKIADLIGLLGKYEKNLRVPVYSKATHYLLRIFINLANRTGKNMDFMSPLMKNDLMFLNFIIKEKDPDRVFQLISFPTDFLKVLKEIAVSPLCLNFYNIS